MVDQQGADGGKQGGADDKFAVAAPSLSLPKGGGAIRGIGEKFAANPVTGTGSMTVPIATSPGRSGFGPQLSLSYDSGSGNGPFGLGWHLSLPSITRKTDKGLPRYDEAEESDVFILSGVEDLVPVLVDDNGTWERETPAPSRTLYGPTAYRIDRYRPRIEGLFARIERWTNLTDTTDSFWRSISKDNITTWYGRTEESRIFDPADGSRIFSWLLCESYDDKGNVIAYGYKKEDSNNLDLSQAHERNRTVETRPANRYLKRIRYGYAKPYYPDPSATHPVALPADWHFEAVFDYGEHDPAAPVPDDQATGTLWDCRNDPFSAYRATFEVRTYRLCQRVLMFHHFPDEPGIGADCLVRSTDFTYSYEKTSADPSNPIYSLLQSVTQTGYVRQPGGYLAKSLPPIEFEYTQPTIDETVHDLDPESLENLPYGLDGSHYQWVDLDGEGLSGILTEQAESWFYKRNLSPANFSATGNGETPVARFGAIEPVARRPSLAALGAGRQQLLDLAGDGQLDLVELDAPTPGFFERTDNEDWEPFASFTSVPNLDWRNPNLKFVDVTGDGHADVLISHDDSFRWHESLAKAGFGPEERVSQALDEEEGPRLLFADGTQTTFLADLSGDGLADLVRIGNGEVCYWPNLGYSRFGAKVAMDNAPWFENPDLFDGRRVRLADIDGSGTTDIIYFASAGVQLYFNQSGNGWSERRVLDNYPPVDSVSSATALDLLGNGTACLVWSSSLPGNTRRPMRYIDLMGGQKPHLLVKSRNNLGAETHVQYAPSTKFYVADREAGAPWITRIPFPVHVVERIETYDWISRNRFVSRCAYHHGYYDGVEREFRGFGMVEQWDTEELAALSVGEAFPDATNLDAASYVPPVYTKTWFHTGAYFGQDRISKHFEEEYYREGDASEALAGLSDIELEAMLLPDTVLPTTLFQPSPSQPAGVRSPWPLSSEEAREACRALKGSILRQEVYGLDGTDAADRPYSASERNYTVELLQPQGPNRYAVFFSHARETIDFHYERELFKVAGGELVDPQNPPIGAKDAADPRVTHAVTLAADPYGNVLESVAIGYGRRYRDPTITATDPTIAARDKTKQSTKQITYTKSDYTNPIILDDSYRTPLPCTVGTYELIQIQPDPNRPDQPDLTNLLDFDYLRSQVELASQHDLLYEDLAYAGVTDSTVPYRRLIEAMRTFYRPDDLGAAAADAKALLPSGTVEKLALPGESYKLAFTPGLLTQVYQRAQTALLPTPASVLGSAGSGGGGYVDLDSDGHWWVPSGRIFYDPTTDAAPPQEALQAQQHFFLPRRFENPFGQSGTVDYRYDLLVAQTTDAKHNTVGAQSDYRVLRPALLTDANGNQSQLAFDALGLVAGTAVMGKPGENKGDSLANFTADLTSQQIDDFLIAPDPHVLAPDLLGGATTRILYDLDRFRATRDANPMDPTKWQPVFAATLARETHLNDPLPPGGLKIQISFSYSDGFGREVQKKIQAEPGPVTPGGAAADPRWVGSGWTIFNNKGKPVRQYEPFFSPTHNFEFGNIAGVSPIIFFDPAERVVATVHPDHSWEKVVFDPWRQTSYDVNDTVNFDAKTDPDVGALFSRLPDADYLPSWYGLRSDPAFASEAAQRWPDPVLRAAEADAAAKTATHANTPAVAYLDTLGRTFLSLADNGAAGKYATRTELDIDGNQREVIDAKERIVMRYDYDMLGNKIHQASMEAGERWMLNDITAKPIRSWDSRGHNFETQYDELRRPIHGYVKGTDSVNSDPRTLVANKILFTLTEYGEDQPGDVALKLNLRTRVFRQSDGGGVVTHQGKHPVTNLDEAYDFKGNLLRSSRRLVQDYKSVPDYAPGNPQLEPDILTSTTFDALNRPITQTAPDGSITRPEYNEANLLETLAISLQGAATPTLFVANIDYDAKGQRTLIQYGNGVTTSYDYDEQTFRLTRIRSTRPSGLNGLASQLFKNPVTVQDLHYAYDPAGNITRIADDALPVLFFANQSVEPVGLYTYDPLYRLTQARGREHIGQSALQLSLPQATYRDYPFAGLGAQPFDPGAVRNYTERYQYDEVGNFLHLIHQAQNGNWTRDYAYSEPSLTEPGKTSNRLSQTTISTATEIYACDAHGNMTSMPHLAAMAWDFKDQFRSADLGGGGTVFYVYDGAGQRVRKVIERQNGALQKERLYFGGYEIYRQYNGSGSPVTLERETLHVLDDKRRIALVETRTDVPEQLIRYQFGNHLGSSSLELDDAGRVISYEEYYPYGSTSYQAGRSTAEVSIKRYRYTGKERDEETGFTYHGARHYVPWLGSWTSYDPIPSNGRTPYAAFHLSPINYVDRDGRAPKKTNEPGNWQWPDWKVVAFKVLDWYNGGDTAAEKSPTELHGEEARTPDPAKISGDPPKGVPPPLPDKAGAAPTGPEGTGDTISPSPLSDEEVYAAQIEEIFGRISGLLGIVGGASEVHSGLQGVQKAKSKEEAAVSGVHVAAGGATALGGAGVLLGVESLAAAGPPGILLGTGATAYTVGSTGAPYIFGDQPFPHLEDTSPIGPPQQLEPGETPSETMPVEGAGPTGNAVQQDMGIQPNQNAGGAGGAGPGQNTAGAGGGRPLVVSGSPSQLAARQGTSWNTEAEKKMAQDFAEWQELQLRYQYAIQTGSNLCDYCK